MIPLFKVYMAEEAIERCNKVLRSGYVAQGPVVDELETKLRNHLKIDNVVTVNSATSGLFLAYNLIKEHNNLPDGTEVLSSPVTCAATNLPILHNRMRIKWCDINPLTFNIDLESVKHRWSENTRILAFVHWGGYPVNLDAVKQVKEEYKAKFGKELYVVEDAAHAWGSTFRDKYIGAYDPDNYVVFSHQAIKNLTGGDGGTLITPTDTYKRARLLRWFGIDRDNKCDFRHGSDVHYAGYKLHMNDVSAAIILGNFYGSLKNVEIQRENALFYSRNIQNQYVSKVPIIDSLFSPIHDPSYWLYTLNTKDVHRFMTYLKDRGIETNKVHTRNDHLTVFKEFRDDSALPVVENLENRRCCIPIGYHISKSDRQYIVDSINEYY